jgi:hypothetical protein
MLIDLKNIKKVYINLDIDVNRNNKFKNTISQLSYVNVDKFSARSLPKIRDFNHGCSQSHYDLMNEYSNILPLFVLEDDACPTEWYNEYVINGVIDVPDDADAIYLGYSTGGDFDRLKVDFYPEYYNEKWLKLKHCLGTHAILFLKNINCFIDNANHTIQNKIPLDIGYAMNVLPKLKVYAPTKSLFYQWDKCWPTTNVICDVKNKKWTSYKPNGEINFTREWKY